MSDSNSATQKTLKTSFTTPKSSKTCFLFIWKNWHFHGKSWHILVQKAQIEKWISDSDSAGRIYLGNTLFIALKNIFEKSAYWGGGFCKEVPDKCSCSQWRSEGRAWGLRPPLAKIIFSFGAATAPQAHIATPLIVIYISNAQLRGCIYSKGTKGHACKPVTCGCPVVPYVCGAYRFSINITIFKQNVTNFRQKYLIFSRAPSAHGSSFCHNSPSKISRYGPAAACHKNTHSRLSSATTTKTNRNSDTKWLIFLLHI